MRLEGVVHDPKCNPWCGDLIHRDLRPRFVDTLLPYRLLRQRLAEGLAAEHTSAHLHQCMFRLTDYAHRVVDALQSEAPWAISTPGKSASISPKYLHLFEEGVLMSADIPIHKIRQSGEPRL